MMILYRPVLNLYEDKFMLYLIISKTLIFWRLRMKSREANISNLFIDYEN